MVVTVTFPPEDSENDRAQEKRPKAKVKKPRNKYLKVLAEQWLVFCFGIACILGWAWPSEHCFPTAGYAAKV